MAAIFLAAAADRTVRTVCSRNSIDYTTQGHDSEAAFIPMGTLIEQLRESEVIDNQQAQKLIQCQEIRRAAFLDDFTTCSKDAVVDIFIWLMQFRNSMDLIPL